MIALSESSGDVHSFSQLEMWTDSFSQLEMWTDKGTCLEDVLVAGLPGSFIAHPMSQSCSDVLDGRMWGLDVGLVQAGWGGHAAEYGHFPAYPPGGAYPQSDPDPTQVSLPSAIP